MIADRCVLSRRHSRSTRIGSISRPEASISERHFVTLAAGEGLTGAGHRETKDRRSPSRAYAGWQGSPVKLREMIPLAAAAA